MNTYNYTVKGQERCLDPFNTLRQLWMEMDGEFNEILSKSRSQDINEACYAQEKLISAVRRVFSLEDFNGGNGVDDLTCLKVLNDYLAFLNKKKVNLE